MNPALPSLPTLLKPLRAVARRLLQEPPPPPDPLPGCQAPPPAPPPGPATPSGPPAWTWPWRALRSLLRAPAGRYQLPWLLLAGEAGAGKSSLLASVAPSLRAGPRWPDQLVRAGAQWCLFQQGVLIDVNGRQVNSPARWRALLREIELLRPERPLDGILLTVSARTLAQADPARLQAAASAVRGQLDLIQQAWQFNLPLYLAVTCCDTVEGFRPYWQAQPRVPRSEMVGWSAPAMPDGGTPAQWSAATAATLAAHLQALQLRAAAGRAALDQPDQLLLFPHHLRQLRPALERWLDIVCQPGALPGGYLMRGIYFTGSIAAQGADSGQVRADVDFVDDLVSAKVLAERNLAAPARAGLWARSRWQRAIQIGLAALMAALVLGLCSGALALRRDVDQLGKAVAALDRATQAMGPVTAALPCPSRASIYGLLEQANRVRPTLPYLPWSWLDPRPRSQSTQRLAEDTLARTILPALRCSLGEQARRQLLDNTAPNQTDPARDSQAGRQQLFHFLDQLLALERDNRLLQQAAAAAQVDPQYALRALYTVMQDVYGAPPPGAHPADSPLVSQLSRWGDMLLARLGLPPAPASARPAAWRVDQDGALYQAMRQLPGAAAGQGPEPIDAALHAQLQGQIDQLYGVLAPQLQAHINDGAALLSRLAEDAHPGPNASPLLPTLLDDVEPANDWLNWVRQAWLPASAARNPCRDIADGITRRKSELDAFHYQVAALAPRLVQDCFDSALDNLKRLNATGFGALLALDGQRLAFSPAVQSELAGLAALPKLDFMRVRHPLPFTCQPQRGWDKAGLARVTSLFYHYQRYLAKHPAAPDGGGALSGRIALHQLELVMNDSLNAAQLPAAVPADSSPDVRLNQDSARFAASSAPLAAILGAYQSLQPDTSYQQLNACLHNQAAQALGRVADLANQSSLYALSDTPSGTPLFNLGGPAMLDQFLSNQVARMQILSGYAAPYAQFLHERPGLPGQHASPSQLGPYWDNTIRELNQFVVSNDRSGAVGKLHDLFGKTLLGLDRADCRKTLDGLQPDQRNDWFTQRRNEVLEQAKARCGLLDDAALLTDYLALADDFNRELASHFPFGTSSEVPLAQLRKFLASHAKLPVLRARADQRKEAAWAERRAFLDQLDDALSALRPLLTGAPLTLNASFNATPQNAAGADQIITWTLRSGASTTGWPNRTPTTLEWSAGQPLGLDLAWASLSPWRPAPDGAQTDLRISGATASFGYGGDWALLRLFALHGGTPADAGNYSMLHFEPPLAPAASAPGGQPTGQARVFLGLALSGKDPKTQATVALQLPAAYPTSAPH